MAWAVTALIPTVILQATSWSLPYTDNAIIFIIIFYIYTDCFIDNSNRTYNICSTTQSLLNTSSESLSRCRELSSGGQTVHSNEQSFNCTIDLIADTMIFLRCQIGECNYTAKSSNTACSNDLGINCEGTYMHQIRDNWFQLIINFLGCNRTYMQQNS